MDTLNILKFVLRGFFFLTTFLSLRYGSSIGLTLSLSIFLLMEYFLEDLEQTSKVQQARITPYIE